MSNTQGVFIVIDGSDGSGKSTQHTLLKERLEQTHIPLALFDFPQYHQPSAYFVEQYLAGNYGTVDQVPPNRASVFYALDRYEVSFAIREALRSGKVVLADRFTGSNLAHQGAKIADPKKRRAFFAEIETFEHQWMNIPQPDCNLILLSDPQRALQNISKRGLSRDIHEQDEDFLRRSVEVYHELCTLFPKHYIAIDCMQPDGSMKPIEAIHKVIWQHVTKKITGHF